MAVCKSCGHRFGFLEHSVDGLCLGCVEKERREREALQVKLLLDPYLGEKLPEIRTTGAVLSKGEIVHALADTVLKEIKTINLGWTGANQGVSIPIGIKIAGSPVRYRVGQSKGHVVKHDALVETSLGKLIVTNQRLFLNAVAGKKPVSIPLKKIVSFHCYENGLEAWKDGDQHPLLFLLSTVNAEIFGICLDKLLSVS